MGRRVKVKTETKVLAEDLRLMLIDVDRMSMIYNHVITNPTHHLTIKTVQRHSESPSKKAFIEVSCDNAECVASHDGEPWWDEWDFDDTYTASVQRMLGFRT